jgi:hypothetical protein
MDRGRPDQSVAIDDSSFLEPLASATTTPPTLPNRDLEPWVCLRRREALPDRLVDDVLGHGASLVCSL